VSKAGTSLAVLGGNIAFPLCVSPAGIQAMAHPDGELATSHACTKRDIHLGVSSFSNYTIEEVAKASRESGPIAQVMQLHTMKDRSLQERISSALKQPDALLSSSQLIVLFSAFDTTSYVTISVHLQALNFLLEKTFKMIQAQIHNNGFLAFNSMHTHGPMTYPG